MPIENATACKQARGSPDLATAGLPESPAPYVWARSVRQDSCSHWRAGGRAIGVGSRTCLHAPASHPSVPASAAASGSPWRHAGQMIFRRSIGFRLYHVSGISGIVPMAGCDARCVYCPARGSVMAIILPGVSRHPAPAASMIHLEARWSQ